MQKRSEVPHFNAYFYLVCTIPSLSLNVDTLLLVDTVSLRTELILSLADNSLLLVLPPNIGSLRISCLFLCLLTEAS